MNPTSPANRKFLRRLALIAFPGYRGRKITSVVATEYSMENYWDGGTRRECVAVNLHTGVVREPIAATTNPMNQAAHATVKLPPGIALVEHTIFCGKDVGIRIHLAPSADRFLANCSDFVLRNWDAKRKFIPGAFDSLGPAPQPTAAEVQATYEEAMGRS